MPMLARFIHEVIAKTGRAGVSGKNNTKLALPPRPASSGKFPKAGSPKSRGGNTRCHARER